MSLIEIVTKDVCGVCVCVCVCARARVCEGCSFLGVEHDSKKPNRGNTDPSSGN